MTHDHDEPIRVLIVDDHTVVRRGLLAFLAEFTDIVVVGEAGDGGAALAEVALLENAGTVPHVVLMDLIMPDTDGIDAIATISRRHPAVKVIVLTSFSEPDRVRAALAAGAAGYVLKDAGADELVAAVRAAHRGEIHLDAAITRQLTATLRQPTLVPCAITPREREVIALVAAGHSNREIAQQLVISERTARTHVSNILGKLGLSSRTQAAIWARDHNLDDPGIR